MATPDHHYSKERSIGRRKEDWLVRDNIHRYTQLFHVGQIITSEINMDVLFEVIMDQTNQIMDTERSTVFLHDDKSNQLWSLVATGVEKNEIRMPEDYGVAGWVFQHKTSLIINNPYDDPRFNPEVDEKLGFQTKNILCIPLMNRERECIGALEALNKNSGDFTDKDRELLTSISHYVAVALENSKLYEELKLLDKAKERVINHLSHELKTPLALISGVFGRISREIGEANIAGLGKTINRGRRNVNRLLELQEKIDDILNQRSFEEKGRIINIIEDAASFVEEFREETHMQNEEILKRVYRRIESLFSSEEIRMEKIPLNEFLDDLYTEAISSMQGRDLTIIRNFEKEILITMDRTILEKVFLGLIKNAIENTPDEGKIEITVTPKDGEIWIDIHDYGVGITPQNQKMIFGGFFHTQDTDLYSSKRPYEFNAGGSGSDLLRTKSFSERYGFSVDFDSIRGKFIPKDTDMCPGKISACSFITEKSGCFSSGGSTFSIKFPM